MYQVAVVERFSCSIILHCKQVRSINPTIYVILCWLKYCCLNRILHLTQGVLRVRKRVTLMVLTISAIFGICWGAESIEYVLRYLTSYKMSPVPVAIADTMALFNSAVNPFVFALLNQQFREKITKMICCKCSPRVNPAQEDHIIELTNNTSTYPTHVHVWEQCSREWCVSSVVWIQKLNSFWRKILTS